MEMHKKIQEFVAAHFGGHAINVLELGLGTGITAENFLSLVPGSSYTGIDFSQSMLDLAIKRLSVFNPVLLNADYAIVDLPINTDLVLSVIGIHHQRTDKDKRYIFQKIFESLKPDGVFIFGDLVTFRDPKIAALNDALHYHHLVENSVDESRLVEWAYHHHFLNSLTSLEDQLNWLEGVGFKKVELVYSRFNTALVIAVK